MRLAPERVSFGSKTNGLRNWLRICLYVLTAVFCLVFSSYSYFQYKAYRARRLFADLQRLQVGRSSDADVRRLAVEYHGNREDPVHADSPCQTDRCTYRFMMDTGFLLHLYGHGARLDRIIDKLSSITDAETMNIAGMRMWRIVASVTVEHDKVASYAAEMFVEGPCHKWLNVGWRVSPALPKYGHAKNDTDPNRLLVHWNHLHMGPESGEGLTADIVPGATPDERRAAFGLNTDCLSRPGPGCFLLSEAFPTAAQWQIQHGSWPLGWTSQNCHGVEDPGDSLVTG